MDLDVHSESGEVVGQVALDEALLGDRIRMRLLREAVLMYVANRRRGTVRTKTRADRKGSNAKPWRQKGTGRARAGNKRSPIWRKGGLAHGPKNRDYGYSISKKARRAAVKSALLAKLKDREVVVLEAPAFEEPKTRRAAAMLRNLSIEGSCLVTVMPPADDDQARDSLQNLKKSIRNISDTRLTIAHNWNAYDLIRHRHILVTREVVERLGEVLK